MLFRSQNPTAGSTVAQNSAVDIVVSLGPVLVSVPDVVGLQQSDAETAILGATLTVGTVSQVNDPSIPAGEVISQNPSAGATVAQRRDAAWQNLSKRTLFQALAGHGPEPPTGPCHSPIFNSDRGI